MVIKKNHNWSLLIQTIVVHVYGFGFTFYINVRAILDKGLMKSSIFIGQKLYIGPKAFRQGFRTKTNQIVI